MRASSKKRNPLLKGRVAYLSRSKTELVAVLAAEACGESVWETLAAAEILLAQFAFRVERHTLPDDLSGAAACEFLRDAGEHRARAIIVASGDARLPGTLAAAAGSAGSGDVPILRVPMAAGERRGLALLEPLHEPAEEDGGGAFATMAIGETGAKNAALLVVAMLAACGDRQLRTAWDHFRTRQTQAVLEMTLPRAGACDTSRVLRKGS